MKYEVDVDVRLGSCESSKNTVSKNSYVSISEVPDIAVQRDGLPGDCGEVPAGGLEEGRVILEDGLVIPEVLELT